MDDAIQTGVIKYNLGKSVAAGALTDVDAARAGMAQETADLEAKYKGELEGLDTETAPTKPLDLADIYAHDYGESEYGAPTETGGVPEASGATPSSSPALISQGSPNAIANMVGKGFMSHVVGTLATATTMNPVIGLAVSAITNMILSPLMSPQLDVSQYGEAPGTGTPPDPGQYGAGVGIGPDVGPPGSVGTIAQGMGPVTSSSNPESNDTNDPGETGPTPGAPGLGTSGAPGSVTGMSLADAVNANSNDPGEGLDSGMGGQGAPGVADADGGGGGGGK